MYEPDSCCLQKMKILIRKTVLLLLTGRIKNQTPTL